MTTDTAGIGTRTKATRETRKSTAQTQELSRQEREEWIASVDMANLDEPGLPVVPPRAGMEQRWIRSKIGGQTDIKRLAQAEQRGWRPRLANTLTTQYNLRLKDGEFAGYVGVHDLVLMERPIEIGNKVRETERKKVRDLTLAVRSFQNRETENHESERHLIRHEEPELRAEVETGYRPVDIPD